MFSETARIAIQAALTGHLVFSTLHTVDAQETVAAMRRMIEFTFDSFVKDRSFIQLSRND